MLRQQIRRVFTALLMLCFLAQNAVACTLWAASGDNVAGGGSLIVKNRDWTEQEQATELVTPKVGYRYFGVFGLTPATKKTEKGRRNLVAGINEAGLVVVTATASSIPQKQRQAGPHNPQLAAQLLSGSKNVDEALRGTNLSSSMFLGPRILLLADASTIAWVEIGPNGKLSVRKEKNSLLTHTNHFLAPDMQQHNINIGKSSKTRLDRINTLLAAEQRPFTLDRFLALSRDKNAGPDNSLFRTGSAPQKPRTLATFAVSIPPDGQPEVRLWMKDNGDAVTTMRAADLFPAR